MRGVCTILYVSICGFFDFRETRIPNVVHVLFGCLLCAKALLIAPETLPGALFRIMATCLIWFPLFVWRLMGAGDIKMLAMIFGACGWMEGLYCVIAGLVPALGYGLICPDHRKGILRRVRLLLRGILYSLFHPADLASDSKNIRLGVFLAAGTVLRGILSMGENTWLI